MSADRRLRRTMEGLTGILLVAAFFALDRSSNTIEVTFIPPWDASTPGELYFWLGAVMFLLPGAALLGSAVSPLVVPALERAQLRLGRLERRERHVMLATAFVLCAAVTTLGNRFWMHGQPFTDDEEAARFGGQVLANGSLWAPLPPMRFAFPELFLFQRDGHWTSFDFPGALASWALAEWTHTDTLVFSLLAALAVPAVATVVMRRHGAMTGLTAGLIVFCSPMALTLSITSHTHAVSRGLLALGLGLILFVERAGLARSFGAGLAFGLAFATRPPESTMLLTPLALGAIHAAWRDPRERPRLLGLALGMLPGVLATFAYNHALTESFGFARSAAQEIQVPYGSTMRSPFHWARWDDRFGNNFAYNVLTLSIWFLGPLGLPLAWIGARSSRTHLLLGVSVLLGLSLCMLHDDRGLHMVGPIHLSETVLPLSVLASAGLARVLAKLGKLGFERGPVRPAWLSYCVVGLLTFTLWHARALEQQSLAHLEIVDIAEHVPRRPAIVLAQPYYLVRNAHGLASHVGGFVHSWRRARPDLSDDVLIVHDSPQARAEVAHAFPERAAYVLDPERSGLVAVSLDRALPLSALE